MRRVGIITAHFSKNYGTMLQAYAMQTYFENCGFHAEIIDYRIRDKYVKNKWLKRIKQVPSAIINVRRHIIKFLNKMNIALRNTYFDDFYHRYMRTSSKKYMTVTDLKKDPPDYDIYVCGSDQIWNLYLASATEAYFLTFVPRGRKTLAYAPSIGVSKVSARRIQKMQQWLQRVQYLSSREKQGCEIIEEIVKRPVQRVLDPTLLLSPADWEKIAVAPTIKEPYILCYFLGQVQFCRSFAREIQRDTGYKIVNIPVSYIEMGSKDKNIFETGPAEFIGLIKHATVVCTDSFHGIVFCINYHKPFFSFCKHTDEEETSENSRIYDVLELFYLQERLIKPGMRFTKDMLKMNYTIASEILEKERKKSTEYIRMALEH